MGIFKRKKEKRQETAVRDFRVDERLTHIAFIMDGNGRWARKRGFPREYGHKHGVVTLEKLSDYCREIGIRYITVYAFSTENWKRPKAEVDAIMQLLDKYIDKMMVDCEKQGSRIVFLGDKSVLSPDLREKAEQLEEISAHLPLTVNIALNYGARAELVHAFRALMEEGKRDITEEDIGRHLYTAHSPDPDLIVRTGGESRLSNFLLWQAAYSELYITPTLWPDLTEKELYGIIQNFLSRERRYGAVGSAQA